MDKRQKNLWLLIFVMTIMILGATPATALASAPVFDSIYPANGKVLSAGPVTVQVRALDIDRINAGSLEMLINGQKVPAVISFDIKSIDPVTETVIYDFTHATITYRTNFIDGLYKVEVRLRDDAGNSSVKQWSFEVASVPKFQNLTPVPYSSVSSTTPAISAAILHMGAAIDPAKVTMTVNGVAVTSFFNPVTNLVSYTPQEPLPVSAEQTVFISATDINGKTGTVQWSFTVVYPDMPVPTAKADCLRCHSSMPQAHRMTNCAACHDVALRNIYASVSPPPHFVAYSCSACHVTLTHEQGAIGGQTAWWPIDAKYSCEQCHVHTIESIAPKHISTTTGNCTNCHSMVLEREHYRPGRTDRAGNPVDCFTCHTSADANVKSAIATNNTACNACHTSADHAAVHENPPFTALPRDPDMNCAGCHKTAVSEEHISGSFTSSRGYTCATCHESTRTEVTNAISANNLNCEACHIDPVTRQPAVHTSAGSPLHDTAYVLNPEMDCSQCHANNIKTVHVGRPNELANNELMTCDTCHKSTNPAVQSAIVGGSARCDSCHTVRHASIKHEASFNTGDPVQQTLPYHASDCATCHSNPTVAADLSAIVLKTEAGQGYLCLDCHKNASQAPFKPNHSAVLDGETFDTLTLHPNCTTCHTTAADTTIRTLKGQTGYSCQACHTDIEGKHISPTVLTGTFVNCSWCHSDRLISTHLSPTVQLSRQMQCTTCHSAASPVKNQVALKLKGCADCHNGTTLEAAHPDAQYIPRHKAVFPQFMPEYSPDCLKCHSQPNSTSPSVINIHSPYNISCGSCHTNAAFKSAVTSLNTDCSGCHKAEINPGMDMAAAHKPFHNADTVKYPATAECLNCHAKDTTADGMSLLGVHKKDPASPVSCNTCHTSTRQEVANAVAAKNVSCQACHANVNHNHSVSVYEAAPKVNCSSCHSTGTTTDPLTGNVVKSTELAGLHKKYGKDCAACHTAPYLGNVIAGDGTLDMLKTGTAQIYCSTCHNGYTASGYRGTAEARHAAEHQAVNNENVNCSTCHDGTTVKGSFSAPAGTAVSFTGIHTSNGCNTCHDNTKVEPVISPMVGQANPPYNCSACHDGTKAKTHNKQHTVKAYLSGSSDTSCASCHKSGDVAAVHSGTSGSGKAMNCDTCHGANPALPNTASVIKANLSTNANRTGFTCQDCHSSIAGGHSHEVSTAGYDPAPAADCSKCHATLSGGSSELTAVHKDAADRGLITNYGCTTCHNSTFEGTVIKGDGAQDMKQNSTAVIYCNTCHNGTLTDAPGTKYPAHNGSHINATGYGAYKGNYNGTAFDDSAVDCSKCHTSLETKTVHDPAVYPNTGCNSCHQSSNTAVQTVISGAWSRASVKAPYTCASCHNSLPYQHKPEHTGTSTDANALNCAGCHSGSSWSGSNAQVVEVHKNNCNTCHSSSNTVVSKFITDRKGLANQVYSCEGCHTTGGAQTKEALHRPEHSARHSAAGMECSSCHGFTATAGSAVDIKSTAVHMNGCNTCHGSTTRSDVKLLVTTKAGQSNPVYSCEDCHGTIHLGWDVKHKPAFPTNLGMDCSGCHNNYLPGEHTRYFDSGTTASSPVGYKVFRSAASTGLWTEIGSTTATGYADTGLTANTTYYYRIQAYDGKPNLSGFTNTVSVKTLINSPVISTVNPSLARSASGNNGDSSSDPSSTTDAMNTLTDTSDGSYSTTRENGSSDQYVFVRLDRDVRDYTKVELRMRVRYYNSTNLTIYPYSSNGTSINTSSAARVNGTYRSSSSGFTTETIDVTNAAQTMNGYGWMKFRIKPDPSRSAYVYIAKVEVLLSQAAVSGGSAANPPGTLASSPEDTAAPSTPTDLTGTSNYYDRIDLSWTASSDTAGTSASGEGRTCALCHSSTARQQAKEAVAAKNANCSACHTIHGEVETVHAVSSFGSTQWDCSKCHSGVLSTEHANRGLNCNSCHNSPLAKVKGAINSTVTDGSNKRCSTCHTGTADGAPAMHTTIAAPHLTGIFPTATDSTCLGCHTNQAGEFTATKASYHVVQGLTSKAAGGWGQYLSPWTSTSTVGCQGCHGNNNDGLAQTSKILKRPYTATSNSSQSGMLCYMCHDRNTYGGGSDSTGKTGFSGGGKNLHNIGDHKVNNVLQCTWCHTSRPHSTNKAHLVVTRTDPNATGNLLTNFYHPSSGQYDKQHCGSNTSACNDHQGY